ncbi:MULTISPECIES: hypothetical protein [unclassified Frankia]|uniref:hypothetical protein n=1 Tax=unclassified Frankia TaxID=2632575 RepID=UPI002AD27D7A|nr:MULTISPECIES: hypothetical protein [unclassified Frankia]
MAASVFGGDPEVARQVSGELANIRGALSSLGTTFDGLHGMTGSGEVEMALHHFVTQSSDSRESLDKLPERASGLLRGLAEGVSEVDSGLAGVLTPTALEGGGSTSPGAVVPGSPVATSGAL